MDEVAEGRMLAAKPPKRGMMGNATTETPCHCRWSARTEAVVLKRDFQSIDD